MVKIIGGNIVMNNLVLAEIVRQKGQGGIHITNHNHNYNSSVNNPLAAMTNLIALKQMSDAMGGGEYLPYQTQKSLSNREILENHNKIKQAKALSDNSNIDDAEYEIVANQEGTLQPINSSRPRKQYMDQEESVVFSQYNRFVKCDIKTYEINNWIPFMKSSEYYVEYLDDATLALVNVTQVGCDNPVDWSVIYSTSNWFTKQILKNNRKNKTTKIILTTDKYPSFIQCLDMCIEKNDGVHCQFIEELQPPDGDNNFIIKSRPRSELRDFISIFPNKRQFKSNALSTVFLVTKMNDEEYSLETKV